MFKGGAHSYSKQIVQSFSDQVSKYLCAVNFVCAARDVSMMKKFPRGDLIK